MGTSRFCDIDCCMRQQGYRITELNAIVLSGDQVSCNAIWELMPKLCLPLVKR